MQERREMEMRIGKVGNSATHLSKADDFLFLPQFISNVSLPLAACFLLFLLYCPLA